ncbi:MAG: hypothetical protein AABX77_00065 [Nanoarchaeota archaeon]
MVLKEIDGVIETKRYEVAYKEISTGGPGGYESTYLTSEGDPACDELYEILGSFSGKLLPSENRSIRQRNGNPLLNALKEKNSLGIASGFKPSGAYHFGHTLVSSTVAFFQKNEVQAFMPIADIEADMDKKLSREEYLYWVADNLLDWGASGVNLDATHVYLQSEERRVNDLAYVVARGLTFDLPVDIYGMKKMIEDFPFLFAGVTQVGDIILPQHKAFGNYHSFMVSGQDQDGHAKMTVKLSERSLENLKNYGIQTIPSAFYIPHIRGIIGKASSSKPETTIYLGSGPDKNKNEDLEKRINSSLKKIDNALKNEELKTNVKLACLDMVRYIEYFNKYSRLDFKIASVNMPQSVKEDIENYIPKEDGDGEPTTLDIYLLDKCENIGQDNVKIVKEHLEEALTEHQKKRQEVLNYAIARESHVSTGWDIETSPGQPDFWKVPDKSIVNPSLRNPTKWFNLVSNMKDKLVP